MLVHARLTEAIKLMCGEAGGDCRHKLQAKVCADKPSNVHIPNDIIFHQCRVNAIKSGACHTHATLPPRLVLVSLLPMLHCELRPLWSLIDLLHLGRQVKLAKLTFGNTLSNIKGK